VEAAAAVVLVLAELAGLAELAEFGLGFVLPQADKKVDVRANAVKSTIADFLRNMNNSSQMNVMLADMPMLLQS
jgi:type II secretory pathway component GspD/PulD (secretin)